MRHVGARLRGRGHCRDVRAVGVRPARGRADPVPRRDSGGVSNRGHCGAVDGRLVLRLDLRAVDDRRADLCDRLGAVGPDADAASGSAHHHRVVLTTVETSDHDRARQRRHGDPGRAIVGRVLVGGALGRHAAGRGDVDRQLPLFRDDSRDYRCGLCQPAVGDHPADRRSRHLDPRRLGRTGVPVKAPIEWHGRLQHLAGPAQKQLVVVGNAHVHVGRGVSLRGSSEGCR
ncbi:unannotated protein [freshwater metagenome]|uniref:Unannotated protein n=1 Tax=freshwater metagenome TaxID=449393 RepID=A0A6J7K756_9ZZZZ